MKRQLISMIFIVGGILLGGGHGCSSHFETPSFVSRLHQGDQQIAWTLNYFDSWRKGRQPKYLQLAQEHIVEAIDIFSELQIDTSPRVNEFYVVRDRRARSCRILIELYFEAANFGYAINQASPSGCVL